jgi:hypothetical protein
LKDSEKTLDWKAALLMSHVNAISRPLNNDISNRVISNFLNSLMILKLYDLELSVPM